ncbi:methyltransferase RsmF C-terminal domain-like protein [Sphingobacterium faecale]|uniref:RNA methyltransferase n=1 Tax=Sphingobacterium faecale TaxID=2803775 RepID=A0ABS1R758_9SPHI|nr:RNA methyltransferase [Sphingobacterium faecale]MBL1410555.1 RNA methyltransferase [Sphingobacterium faecale]
MSNKLPPDLVRHLQGDPHFDYNAFVSIHDKEQKTSSIRINPGKKFDLSLLDIDREIPWCEGGFYLNKRPIFTLDPLFHAGCYYSQEASSMFLDFVIRELKLNIEPIRALDLCSAPGGKATLLNSTLHKDSLLVANEIIKSRASILRDNLVKWGNANVIVSNNDPSSFSRLPGYFDFAVIDAPCSGSGMFHKDHGAMDEWSMANVKLCSERQKRIIADSIATVRTGGIIFYSTCSYSKEENEDIVDWMIDTFNLESISVSVNSSWGIEVGKSDKHEATSYRFYPHKVAGEGFFCAILKRKGDVPSFSLKKVKMEKNVATQSLAQGWANMEGLYSFLYHDLLHIFPKVYEQDLTALQKVLYLKNAGTEIGRVVGKDLIPSHDLALSNRIHKDIPFLDLDLEEMLTYLRKESLSPLVNKKELSGWIIVRYEGMDLGWIKAMPNRINNYYPKEVRIANL